MMHLDSRENGEHDRQRITQLIILNIPKCRSSDKLTQELH